MKKNKICKICNKNITSKTNKIYCSRKCLFSDKDYLKKISPKGRKSSIETREKISNSLKGRKFSKEHIKNLSLSKQKIKRVKNNCKTCFKDFISRENLNKKFCCKKCYLDFLKIPENNPMFKKGYLLKGEKNGMFNNGQLLKGELNGRWHGGLSFGKYGLEFNNELKEKIRKRDERQCKICGINEKECKQKLDIHHMDYDKKHNSECNLVSLCRTCHAITNSNREYWKNYFKPLSLKLLKEKYGRVSLLLATRDRPSEIALLLQSLRTQTYNLFDIYLLDDCSGTPITTYYFINHICNRMRLEGHRVIIKRNNFSRGIPKMRNQMVKWALEEDDNLLFGRIDDDTIVESDFIERLVRGIEKGYDVMSGITPPIMQPEWKRDTKFVKPFISKCEMDDKGNLIKIGDECGYGYIQDEIIPSEHFRSFAIYKREIHEKDNIYYYENLSNCGFREEEFFSFKCIIAGKKIGVDTQAICWHMLTPSGGDRKLTYGELATFNHNKLIEFVKEQFNKHGNFFETYYKQFEDNK